MCDSPGGLQAGHSTVTAQATAGAEKDLEMRWTNASMMSRHNATSLSVWSDVVRLRQE